LKAQTDSQGSIRRRLLKYLLPALIALLLLGGFLDYVTVNGAGRVSRDVAIWWILGGVLMSDFIQLAVIVALVLLAVTWGLQPLQRMCDEFAARSPHELTTLDERGVPAEMRPVVRELNRLIATVHETMLSKEELLANAAHQLRTPLTGMQAQLELVLADPRSLGVRPDLHMVHQATQRLAHTAHQLLALARAEPSKPITSDFKPVDLRELLEDVIDNELDRALARGIDLGADLRETRITGIAWLLRELLANLVDNALKYTPDGGKVTVRCGIRDGFAFIEVEDDGAGIPVDERSRVVERFYRMPHTAGFGCGLGLAIASEVARSHGSTLVIDSGERGVGTLVSVCFRLPGPFEGTRPAQYGTRYRSATRFRQ
jgi:two-component system sensor histidine kinase TctE